MLNSKIITEIIENHSEFSGCSKSCNDCSKSILINYEIPYDTAIKSSVVGDGGAGGASALPKVLIC